MIMIYFLLVFLLSGGWQSCNIWAKEQGEEEEKVRLWGKEPVPWQPDLTTVILQAEKYSRVLRPHLRMGNLALSTG